MKLRDALKEVVRFARKGEPSDVLTLVRFIPGVEGNPSRVMAHDGQVGSIVVVDGEVPNVAIHADEIKGILKGCTALADVVEAPDGQVLFNLPDNAGTFNIAPVPFEGYEYVPDIPKLSPVPDWWVVSHLVHLAGKDPNQPHLTGLRFNNDVVEASDRERIGRVFVETGIQATAPTALFKSWPKGEVSVGHEDHLIAFQIGDITRFGICVPWRNANFEGPMPVVHRGSGIVVDSESLRTAVSRSAAMGDSVSVKFAEGEVALESGSFHDVVAGDSMGHPEDANPQVRVEAKRLVDALKAAVTPRVFLGYDGGLDPIRIESGAYSVGIWPQFGD